MTQKRQNSPCPICRKAYELDGNAENLTPLLERLLHIANASRLILIISIMALAAVTILNKPHIPRPDIANAALSASALFMVSSASIWLSSEWTIHQIHKSFESR